MDALDNAQVVDYKALLLPPGGVQLSNLQSIKQFVKSFLQHKVNKALSLFTYADDHHKETVFYKAKHAREAALKKLEICWIGENISFVLYLVLGKPLALG